MKININNYTKILYEILLEANERESSIIIENFVKLLARNNHLRYSKRIISEFERFYNKQNRIIKVQAKSKEMLEEDVVEKIKVFYKNKGAKKVELEQKIDPQIIGGIFLQTDDEMVDFSVKGELTQMKKNLLQ